MLARDREGKPFGVIVMAEGLAEFLPQLRELRTHIAARPAARRTGGGMNRVAKREKLIESVAEAMTKLK